MSSILLDLNSRVAVASLRRPLSSPFVEAKPTAHPLTAWAARTVTLVRVPIAALGVGAVLSGQRLAAVLLFTLFAAIDLADGVAARQAGVDTAARRAGDVILDRVAIHTAAFSCCMVYSAGFLVWAILLSRDVIQAVTSARFVARTGVLVVGAHWHMSYGLSMLLWGSGFIITGSPIPVLTLIAAAVSVVTFADYMHRCRELENRYSWS